MFKPLSVILPLNSMGLDFNPVVFTDSPSTEKYWTLISSPCDGPKAVETPSPKYKSTVVSLLVLIKHVFTGSVITFPSSSSMILLIASTVYCSAVNDLLFILYSLLTSSVLDSSTMNTRVKLILLEGSISPPPRSSSL